MQAIITKYIPATNTKPSRIKASCERGSLIQSIDHSLNDGENHRSACDALCAQFDAEDIARGHPKSDLHWGRPKASGQIPTGEYVFCFIPERVYKRGAK